MPVTLLAVDDSVTMRKVLEMTFSGEDYRVVTADSADSALALARSERPAVVLADATMEGKSGYDLCQALKRDMPNVPVVVLSSKLHPYDPAKGQAARVDDHIDKPFDTQQLIDKVRAVLNAPAAQVSPKPPAVAPAAARPAAPAPAQPRTGMATQPAPVRPVAPAAPAAAGARPAVPANLRQTIQYPPTGAPAGGTSPAPGPAQPRPQPRPASATLPQQPAVQPARPAAPAAPVVHAAPPAAPVAHAAPAAPVAAAAVAIVEGDMGKKLAALGLTKEQIEGVLALSHDVVERVVWEVVPMLAETMIKEELQRLTAD